MGKVKSDSNSTDIILSQARSATRCNIIFQSKVQYRYPIGSSCYRVILSRDGLRTHVEAAKGASINDVNTGKERGVNQKEDEVREIA